MNVIDSLVVKLGLDSSDFKKGEKQVSAGLEKTRKDSEKTAKGMQDSGKQAAEFYTKVSGAALRLFSVLTVGRGLGEFTKSIIGTGAQLDRMAKNFGTSTDRLSRWTAAVKINGGTAEGFLGTMQSLSSALTELKLTGNTGILPYLQALGVAVSDASGQARPLEEIILDIGDKLGSLSNRSDAFNIGKNLGFDDATINLLLKGRGEVEKLLAAQQAYTSADAKAAREASERWEQTSLRLEKLGQTLVTKLLPAFESLMAPLEKFGTISAGVFTKSIEGWGMIFDLTKGWVDSLWRAVEALEKITGFKIGEKVGKGMAQVLAFFGDKDAQQALDNEAAGKRSQSPNLIRKSPSQNSDMNAKFSAAEKAAGLPPGTLAAIKKQETGNRQDFMDDPSKYHYAMVNGKRKSSAFGLFGILDSTAKDPGYGVSPLKNKSVDEQIRFASQYAAARIRAAGGDVKRGLANYGEGENYANQVMANMPNGGSVFTGSGSKTVSIGEIKVYTQATDAQGIAKDIGQAMMRNADTGMR